MLAVIVVVMLCHLGLATGLSLWYFIVIMGLSTPYGEGHFRLYSKIQTDGWKRSHSELFYLAAQIVNRIN